MKKNKVELFTEVLASDKLGAFQNYSSVMANVYSADNPSATWEQLKFNPWVAMAVYWDMEEKNGAIYSALDTRKNNVLSKPRNILPASDKRQDKKIAEFVEETLVRYFHHFDSFLYESLDAIGKGVSIGEIIFAEAADRIYIKEVKFKPQHLFSFGETGIAGFSTASMIYPQTGPLQLRQGVNIANMPLGGELPEDKFFVFSFRPKHGNRWGDPTDRKGFWPDWIIRASLKNWLKYQEKGSGVVIAKYPGSSGEKEQNDALSAAIAVQEETAVAIPDKFELTIEEMVRNIGSSHKELVDDYCNAQISRIYLGQTLTSRGSDGGGSRALGEVHERVSDKIGETDCKSLMQVVNDDIIRPLVFLNFGPDAALPRWVIEYESKEDLDSKAKRYGIVRKEIGLDLSKQQVREDLELEEPKDEDDTLGASVDPQPGETEEEIDPQKAEFAEKKKVSTAFRHAVELEDGALQEAAAIYDRILGSVISEIGVAGLRRLPLDNLLVAHFQHLDNLLSEAAFASYLLAYDTAAEECRDIIGKDSNVAFAEDDEKPKRRLTRRKQVRIVDYPPHGKDQTAAEITDDKTTPFSLRFDVPPQEAIDYFKRKRVLPADKFYKLEAEAKAGAFAVGKVYKTDVTIALQNELLDALENGRTQREVIGKLKDILTGAGHKMLGDQHLETVFRTTTQMAYGVGRRIAQEEASDYLPYWEYSAVGDDRTRPTHRALDGSIYPVDHPFWDSYYPPWDFRCRCSVFPVFNYPKAYDHAHPNKGTSVDYDAQGLPIRAAVDNQVVRINTTKFQGVPRQANLEQVLKDGAQRALESRK